jgi:YHS domain-containing protein
MCPVSGKPIDAGKLVVYKGRVVGLCCEHCAQAFLADPEKYAEKLPKP